MFWPVLAAFDSTRTASSGTPRLSGTFLASQLIRRLQSFRAIGLDELLDDLATAL